MTLIRGLDTPPTVWNQSSSPLLNWLDGSPVPGTPEVGIAFIAPTSGSVMVIVGGGVRDSDGTNRVFLRPEVYLGTSAAGGSLTQVLSGSFREFASTPPETQTVYGSRASILTDLFPGEVYYARVTHYAVNPSGGAVSATNDVFCREIVVVPL